MAGRKARSAVFTIDIPAIHVLCALFKTWMPGTGLQPGRPTGRTRLAGHDEWRVREIVCASRSAALSLSPARRGGAKRLPATRQRITVEACAPHEMHVLEPMYSAGVVSIYHEYLLL